MALRLLSAQGVLALCPVRPSHPQRVSGIGLGSLRARVFHLALGALAIPQSPLIRLSSNPRLECALVVLLLVEVRLVPASFGRLAQGPVRRSQSLLASFRLGYRPIGWYVTQSSIQILIQKENPVLELNHMAPSFCPMSHRHGIAT